MTTETYDFVLNVGASQQISAYGNYVRYQEGSAGGLDNQITIFSTDGTGKINLYPGQKIKFHEGYPKWVVSNSKNQATITGKILIGDGDFDDSNVTGVVQTVDTAKSRTMAKIAYLGSYAVGAVAGQFNLIELWNPAGSGKNLILESVSFSSNVAQQVASGIFNVAHTIGTPPNPLSKLGGGPNSTMEMRFKSAAALVAGTDIPNQYQLFVDMSAGQTFPMNLKEPVVLPPGYGFLVWGGTANAALRANFEYYEEQV